MLKIEDLHVKAESTKILKGFNIKIKPGEIHVLFGPNGSGKSSLCNVLMGHPDYSVEKGKMEFNNKDLMKLSTEERSQEGLFLGSQQPREIPGVSLAQVMKAAIKSRKNKEGDQLELFNLANELRDQLKTFDMEEAFLKRSLNEGASGGEKKRLEMIQLRVLKPKLAILDEIDSGLDIDAIRQIAETIKKTATEGTSFLLVTHYQRLLQYLEPDKVYIMVKGQVVKSGGYSLVEQLEKEGYKNLINDLEDLEKVDGSK